MFLANKDYENREHVKDYPAAQAGYAVASASVGTVEFDGFKTEPEIKDLLPYNASFLSTPSIWTYTPSNQPSVANDLAQLLQFQSFEFDGFKTEPEINPISMKQTIQNINHKNRYSFGPTTVEVNSKRNSRLPSSSSSFYPKSQYNKRFTKTTHSDHSEFDVNRELENINLDQTEITMESLKSIGIGPLCRNTNNWMSIMFKFHKLYKYLSMLSNERKKLEGVAISDTEHLDDSNNDYFTRLNNNINSHIKFALKWIHSEFSLIGDYINTHKLRLDEDMQKNSENLLRNFYDKISNLQNLENVNYYQRNGEILAHGRQIIELEMALSELIMHVRYSCVLFYIISHNNLLEKTKQENVGRARRNLFIG